MFGFGKKVEKVLSAETLQRQVKTIENVSSLLISGTPLEKILEEIAIAISNITKVSLVAILLWNDDEKQLRLLKTSIPKAAELFVEAVTRKGIKEIIYPTDDPNNLFTKAMQERKIQFTPDVVNALTPLMDKGQASMLVRIVRSQISLLVVVPMVVGEKVHGVIALGWKDSVLPETEQAILKTFSNQAAIGIENAGYIDQIKTQLEIVKKQNIRLEAINKFTSNIITTLDPAKVVQEALDSLPGLFGYIGAVFSKYDDQKKTFAIHGFSRNRLTEKAFDFIGKNPLSIAESVEDPKYANNINIRALKEGKIIFSDQFSELTEGFIPDILSNQIQKFLNVSGYVAVPIKMKNKLVGVLDFFFTKKNLVEIRESELNTLIILTNQFTVALENASLYAQVGQALEQLKMFNNQLQEKYQFEKDMMGIMGHELRTPMTVARGLSELVLAKAATTDLIDKPYLKDKLEKIHTSIIKESDLIQTLLSASHVDNNKFSFNVSRFDFIALVDFAVMTFKNDANSKNLELTFTRPASNIEIISDQARIQEVVTNLISNAVKYTNEGSVMISIEQREGDIYFSVKDTGIGIPKEEMKNLGKKFYRVNQHLDNNVNIVRAGGTGLGLYVVKGVLEGLGGRLDIVSELGKGSTFTAVIPLRAKVDGVERFSDKPLEKGDMFQELGMEKK
jgi:signal transduction histidine kinase